MNRDAEEAAKELGADHGMDKALQELEEATSGDSISDKDFNKLLAEYDDLTKNFLKEIQKSKKEDVTAITDAAKTLGDKLAGVANRMKDEQRKKLEEIQKKYDEAFARFNKK